MNVSCYNMAIRGGRPVPGRAGEKRLSGETMFLNVLAESYYREA